MSDPPKRTVKRKKGRLPCLTRLNESKLAPGASKGADGEEPAPAVQKTNIVTQKQAKEWYNKATSKNRIGEGAFGETRSYSGMTPIGTHVAIKRFSDITQIGRDMAEAEACSHMQVWLNSSEECQKHFAQPAEMEFETDPNEGSYTVQALVYDPSLRTMTFNNLLLDNQHLARVNRDKNWLHKLDYDDKFKFCDDYGTMLGCIAKARAVHQDLHGGNVLCVTNFPEDLSEYRQYICDKTELVLRWYVIDWGRAQVYGQQHTKEGDSICTGREGGEVTWQSKFGWKSAADHLCIYDGTTVNVPGDLFELFFDDQQDCDDADDRTECITIADVVHWVREAYAHKLGLTIPEAQNEAVKAQAKKDRDVRNYISDDEGEEEGEEEEEEEGEEEECDHEKSQMDVRH